MLAKQTSGKQLLNNFCRYLECRIMETLRNVGSIGYIYSSITLKQGDRSFQGAVLKVCNIVYSFLCVCTQCTDIYIYIYK
jgi:hypothetical protein